MEGLRSEGFSSFFIIRKWREGEKREWKKDSNAVTAVGYCDLIKPNHFPAPAADMG